MRLSIQNLRSLQQFAADESLLNLLRAMPAKFAALRSRGPLPAISRSETTPETVPNRPISFVVVEHSAGLKHNLLASSCVQDPLNELICIDARSKLQFPNFISAVISGIARAKHSLVALVQEDVFFPDNWQARLQEILPQLEREDPSWAIIGTSGKNSRRGWIGHHSDPFGYHNSFTSKNKKLPFALAASLDDQFVLFKNDHSTILDEGLPGDCGYGHDLVLSAAQRHHRSSYVIDCPIIIELKDAQGNSIHRALDSTKFQDSFYSRYRAKKFVCLEYLSIKWPEHKNTKETSLPCTNATSTKAASTNPVSTNPTSMHPASTNPLSTNPTSMHPASTNPLSTNPTSTHPASTNPVSTNPVSTNPTSTHFPTTIFVPRYHKQLDSPIILLSRGGGGSRLLSIIASDCGIFLGNQVNSSGDCIDMTPAIYNSLFRKFLCNGVHEEPRSLEALRAIHQAKLSPEDLRNAAANMLLYSGLQTDRLWGFKLPEALLLIPQLHDAFPTARYVFMHRHPLAGCLGRSHQTAELDNPIGQMLLPIAYRRQNRSPLQALEDSQPERIAYSIVHQDETALADRQDLLDPRRSLSILFEDMLLDPENETQKLSSWLATRVQASRLTQVVDLRRATTFSTAAKSEQARKANTILHTLYTKLPYDPNWDPTELQKATRSYISRPNNEFSPSNSPLQVLARGY